MNEPAYHAVGVDHSAIEESRYETAPTMGDASSRRERIIPRFESPPPTNVVRISQK